MLVFLHGKEQPHGCEEVVYQLKVKLSVCFTQPCSILPLLWGWKAVGQSSGISVWIQTHPHTCGLGMGSWVGGSHSQGQQDHGAGERAPGLLWHSRIAMRGQHPCGSFSVLPLANGTISSWLRGQSSYKLTRALWSQWSKNVGQKIPSWKSEPCFGCGLVCTLLTALEAWAKGLRTGEFYSVWQQASMVGPVKSGQVMQEQTLGSESIWRDTIQFLYTTILPKLTN